jgi:FkbM family methyltransferase
MKSYNRFLSFRIKLLKFFININERLLFEKKLIKFYKRSAEKKIFFDVGANQGQTIDFFLRLNIKSEIYAFEPNRKLFKKLEEKYKKFPNVKLYMLGVSNQDGFKTFYENVFDFTSTFEKVNENSIHLQKKGKVLGLKSNDLIIDSYDVEVVTLSSFICEKNIKNIDILKIDTEGHELACLQGLFSTKLNCHIDMIQTEKLNGDLYGTDFNSIIELLALFNFKLVKKIKHGFGNFEDVVFKKIN